MASPRIENQMRRSTDKAQYSALSVGGLLFLLLLTKVLLNVWEEFRNKFPANTEGVIDFTIRAVSIIGSLATTYFIFKSSVAEDFNDDAVSDSSRLRLFSPAINQKVEPTPSQLIGNIRGK